jgi:hypothetical protein
MKSANPPKSALTSRFATSSEDLEVVLNLRRAFFKDKPVSPDSSYRRCWAINPHSMKVVYELGEPVGYWSLIPTTRDAYQSFLSGTGSHEEMLAKRCVQWFAVKEKEAYLYIVGAVVPGELESANRLRWKLISGGLLIDWCVFISALLVRTRIRGICGYPSREHGYELFEKLGFMKSSVLIGLDGSQPIFSLDERRMDHFRQSLSRFTDSSGSRVPIWDVEDKRIFFDTYGL